MRLAVCGVSVALTFACTSNSATPTPDASARPLHVLFFQEEGADVGWYHTSNPVAERAMRAWGNAHNWQMQTARQSTGWFTPEALAQFDVVVYLLSSGTVLDASERAALQGFIESGGGYAGVHSASFTDPDWQWYIGLVGARFNTESDKVYEADVIVEQPQEWLLSVLPHRWHRADQWYEFLTPPEDNHALDLLISLDESGFPAGYPDAALMGYHPIAWRQANYDGGRSFYTAMGHTDESYYEPLFIELLARGIEWAGDPSRNRAR